VGDAGTPMCLDSFLLAAVVDYETRPSGDDAEEDEPVAGRKFGTEFSKAYIRRLGHARGGMNL